MFLCAMAKPRYDYSKQCVFDGKIGMWQLAQNVPAARSSKNRPRGTEEWKPIPVTKEVYRQFICEKVVPAIKELWPASYQQQKITIVQDNAPAHISPADAEFLAVANMIDGWDISLCCQPPNSPDLNVLDLGLFAGLGREKHKVPSDDLNMLEEGVLQVY